MRLVLCVILLACLASVSKAAGSLLLLKPASFQNDLPGWISSGQAEFVPDREQSHNGFTPVRISIAPGVGLAYQQLQWRFTDIAADDEFRGEVWIKTQGVAAAPGAYIALEYLDENGKRVGIDHGSAHVTTAPDWQRVALEGYAPQGVKSARLNLHNFRELPRLQHPAGLFAWSIAARMKRPSKSRCPVQKLCP